MAWYVYVAYFFGGAFLGNFVPHFVNGVSGRKFPSPFGKPPGKGVILALVQRFVGALQPAHCLFFDFQGRGFRYPAVGPSGSGRAWDLVDRNSIGDRFWPGESKIGRRWFWGCPGRGLGPETGRPALKIIPVFLSSQEPLATRRIGA